MIHKVSVVVVEVLLVADLAPPFLWLFEQIPCPLQALMALPIADYSFRRRQSCVDGCRTAEVISSFALRFDPAQQLGSFAFISFGYA